MSFVYLKFYRMPNANYMYTIEIIILSPIDQTWFYNVDQLWVLDLLNVFTQKQSPGSRTHNYDFE